jgi:hypothetical protein
MTNKEENYEFTIEKEVADKKQVVKKPIITVKIS